MQDFDTIYADYFAEVYHFALTLCHDPVLAEEVTQETFFKALRHIDSFKGQCALGTWLCKIAKNTYFSYAKKLGKQTDYPTEFLPSPENMEEALADQETAYAIYQVLHRLKEPYKEVFWLRTFGELSFAQIGTLFEKTETWARVTYYRAKVMIKEELS